MVLLQHFHTLVQAVRDIASALRTLSVDPSLTAQQRGEITAFADVFVERLLNRLGVDYLETRFPHIALALIVTGGIEDVREDGGPDGSLNGPYIRKTFHLKRLLKLCTDPAGLLRNVYRVGY